MGPPPRSPATEANDCFMVQVPLRMDLTEYKVAARKAPGRRLPSDHRSTEEECEDRRQALTERVPYKAVGQSLDLIIPERQHARHWDGYREVMRTGESRYDHGDLLSVPSIRKDGRASRWSSRSFR